MYLLQLKHVDRILICIYIKLSFMGKFVVNVQDIHMNFKGFDFSIFPKPISEVIIVCETV